MKQSYLQFKISKENDVDLFFAFIKQSENVKKALFKFMEIEDSEISKEQLFEFVDLTYKKDLIIIEGSIKEVEEAWVLKQEFFSKEIKKIFKGSAYLRDDIVVSPSIWPIYGRFFDKNLITFPYRKGVEEAVIVVVHEILHIIFYNYIHFKYKFSPEVIASKKVWDFSEVFNAIIQNQKSWQENYISEAKPYAEHQELYEKLSVLWRENPDIDYLVENYLV